MDVAIACALMNNAKPSRTSRKQNRCCDQCRKGKRACNAIILEDTLLDMSASGGNPTVFHYSDVFGPLVACGNCEKTRKECTFEWLRSQRTLQANQSTQSPPNAGPRTKRRRTQSDSVPPFPSVELSQLAYDEAAGCLSNQNSADSKRPVDLNVMSTDFPEAPAYFVDTSLEPTQSSEPMRIKSNRKSKGIRRGLSFIEYGEPPQPQSKAVMPETPPEHVEDTIQGEDSTEKDIAKDYIPESTSESRRPYRNRRRRRTSSASRSGNSPLEPAIAFASDFVSAEDKTILTESLLQIYHDGFENALACWLTERTCPYSTKADVTLANETGPSWNRIYHRVFRLDRLTSFICRRHLSPEEDQSVSKALNLSIFSFATQWAQSSNRTRARYPFQSGRPKQRAVHEDAQKPRYDIEFDRSIQVAAWHKARIALQAADKVESFRLVLARFVFSLTQKPIESSRRFWREDKGEKDKHGAVDLAETEEDDSSGGGLDRHDTGYNDGESLMAKLNFAIDSEGPSIHLEQGLRLIHSLRSRMAMCGDGSGSKVVRGRQYQTTIDQLDSTDRATVDLLFWLGVMFDTLSSAMHRRPLVISDEDSDMYTNEPRLSSGVAPNGRGPGTGATGRGWDEHLFAFQGARLQQNPVRWPCTFEQASALLCDAAPVKILLYRKITRIQTLIARNHRGEAVEKSIKAALDVYYHWEKLYAPFISDCMHNHDRLPSEIQSWYACLTGHWHFAALLLADLVEIVDESGLGTDVMRAQRNSCEVVPSFRESNSQTLSDLARYVYPRDNTSFASSHSNGPEVALLTEPWTTVLIRAFARAGVILLDSETMLPYHSANIVWTEEEAFRRADDCVRALWYLGRKSDIALAAARVLGEALKARRRGAREKLDRMTSFLEADLWHGFTDIGETFGLNVEK